MGVRFDLVLAGNDPVSRDTATALADGLLPRPPVVDSPAFGPEGNAEDALKELWDAKSDIRIAAVGCEPIVGIVASRLIGARHPFSFKKAAACCIDIEPGDPCGRLRWFLPPKILREMGRLA